jgi:hypothetical protein
MDVRFCDRRDHSREAPDARAKDLDQKSARSRERAWPRVFFLDRRLTWMSCAFLNNVRRGYHHTTLELLLHSNIWTKERLADYLIPRVQKNLKSVEASKGAPHVA